MRRAWMIVPLFAIVLSTAASHAAASASCSAGDTLEFGGIGSRHCEITLSCPAGTCSWKLSVSVSGIGTVHGWVSDQQVDCEGINSCNASKTIVLSSGQSRQFMCLMDAPVIAVNEAMSCTGQSL
jgi:hypothetical protein